MMYPTQITGGESSVLVKEAEISEVLGKLKPNHACSSLRQSVMNEQSAMNDFHEQLRQLARETCQHPPNSLERRKCLTRLIREIQRSGKLWRENVPYYEDALQDTLLYCSQNLCCKYDPNRGSPVTWLNTYLKWRLHDYRIDRSGDNNPDPLENLPARPEVPPILEEVRHWVETDPDRELHRVCIRGHPEINCQVLILRRLPPETIWEDLAEEFDLSHSTLSCFYQRKCIPCLREFGKSQGYL